MTVRVTASALLDVARFFDALPRAASQAAYLAINDTMSRRGLPDARRAILKAVAFPAGYLDAADRLSISQTATPTRLESRMTARMRPTSLARFSIGGSIGSRGGVQVRVKGGGATRTMARAFLLPLRSGTGGDAFNLGLAIRLRPGETLANKRDVVAKQYGKSGSLYLLYGPSVDQVFRQVSADIAPGLAQAATGEFLRQFDRLSRTL
jgi:hypothetical protein